MKRILPLLLGLAAAPVPAETLVAASTIRPATILGPEHLSLVEEAVPGALSHPSDAIGQEARVVLYAGRPIRAVDLGPPALVDRNQIVTLVYKAEGLSITTDGRALDRAAAGEPVRVLNMASRSTVIGIVDALGQIQVGFSPAAMENQ